MFELFLALFLAFATPGQTTTNPATNTETPVTPPTGGEGGHIPPIAPPPPAP